MVLVGAIDQGTSSSRFLVFEVATGELICSHQIEVKQLCPKSGWVEMDPLEIYATVMDCMTVCCHKLADMGIEADQIKAIGLCNQRETTVVWDRETGAPLHNAIVWLDTRTSHLVEQYVGRTPAGDKEYFKSISGLPIHSYFSALKLRWLLDNVEEVSNANENGTLLFGTVDSWLLWKLTGQHVTDVTNASRTLLFDLAQQQWSQELCDFFEIPLSILPSIKSPCESYGEIQSGPLRGVLVTGCLGDQQAAMVGHNLLQPGEAKSTYGTGTFLLCNTGNRPIISSRGLLATAALGPAGKVSYALEGSGSIGGNVVRFLRDNFAFISNAADIEGLASSVTTTNGVYFVPCFNGLFTPYWDSDARGTICGLSHSSNRAHIALAALKAAAFQTAEIIEAIEADLGKEAGVKSLKIDGGMTTNEFFNQLLAEVLGREILCPRDSEVSAWGAAVAAAIGANLIAPDEMKRNEGSPPPNCRIYRPEGEEEEQKEELAHWKEAVRCARTFGTK